MEDDLSARRHQNPVSSRHGPYGPAQVEAAADHAECHSAIIMLIDI
jgi:hypothetical protein